ncbi:uncharacterized protein LOC141668618 [Apium graveolens]|uniref:uncharacterized protein LOC141668618 n=1 Tax=Apium graveolens TaxID=4045 RepID=UPI003D7AE846
MLLKQWEQVTKSEKLDDGKRLIEMMNERGEYPDIVAYTTLLQAYCTQDQMDGALAVLCMIKTEMMVPSCYTYNILLDAYCRQMKLNIAMDLYRNMAREGLKPTVETHGILLHWLQKHCIQLSLQCSRSACVQVFERKIMVYTYLNLSTLVAYLRILLNQNLFMIIFVSGVFLLGDADNLLCLIKMCLGFICP